MPVMIYYGDALISPSPHLFARARLQKSKGFEFQRLSFETNELQLLNR